MAQPKRLDQDEEVVPAIRHEDAEWKIIQQNTFTRWVNNHLQKAGETIGNLETELSDGRKLIALAQVLSHKNVRKFSEKVDFRWQKLENVSVALNFFKNEENVKIVNIDSSDIVDRNTKLILGLIFTLKQHYKKPRRHSKLEIFQESSSRAKKPVENPTEIDEKTAITEIYAKLRQRGQPIILFGECDLDVRKRLHQLELTQPDLNEGWENELQTTMKGIMKKIAKVVVEGTADSATRHDIALPKGYEEDNWKSIEHSSTLLGVGDDMKRDCDIILSILKYLLARWAKDLNERPLEVKKTPRGMHEAAHHKQTILRMKNLMTSMEKYNVNNDIRHHLAKICRLLETNRNYLEANNAYMEMAIGNAPWPVGVTRSGIHQRPGSAKAHVSNIAHVLKKLLSMYPQTRQISCVSTQQMSDRSFGNDIGNTTTMTASTADDITDVSLAKNEKLVGSKEQQMEKAQNGSVTSRLPRPLAIEVYTKVHNSTLSKDGLWDELDDIVDEKYYEGEVLLSSGKEFVVVSSEKRGRLTIYKMDDGSKIGHRYLKRKKGLSVDEIKQIATEDADFIDGKWVVREDLLKEYPIRETIKYASIFCTKPAKKQAPPTSEGEESGKEDGEEGGERNGGRNPRRSTRGVPAGNIKAQDKQRQSEAKEKKEKEKAQAKKNLTLDKFVKKSNGSPINSKNGTAAFFSPSKWAERRVATGVKKMEEAWKKRDQEAYQEACGWCEKNLSGPQQKSIENPIWRFSVQKLVDKTEDKAQIKILKNRKEAEFKAEMAEKRKAQYQEFEPKIRAWFSEKRHD